ncbi:pyridoxamine 5'-phosphate oxidase family protein [Thalassovita mangrovi]|uniref:Pyridoxamine 5'-phosphate oxidase family protein n=1 Tax=Thalassovita mangrovi TaxID=2692236 RepID=A0A6L8LLY6_9RHOB|nr:pyridoxamine 5'-phosphate oxidase family protein [Thalassovita mangrovi]MYM57004.1 pyridoxamine 5'-phosphate oxidase family protein [Thalassovita mangrovi]
MQWIEDIEALEALYGEPGEASLKKVARRMTPEYRRWIMASRFCVVSTVGPEGADGSPRGDDGPVVLELDEHTLALPDWRGNNRIDTLRNIVRDPRIALMFMVPGSSNAVRVNGEARVTADEDLIARFDRNGKQPRSVIVIRIQEIYTQCARAIIRARLWSGEDESGDLPTVGQILSAMTEGDFDGESYDRDWAGRAATTMW